MEGVSFLSQEVIRSHSPVLLGLGSMVKNRRLIGLMEEEEEERGFSVMGRGVYWRRRGIWWGFPRRRGLLWRIVWLLIL